MTIASPWTDAQERRIVERAVRFIRARKRKAEMDFALEVGEHLFKRLMLGRVDVVRAQLSWKTRALNRIARDRRVRIPEAKLRAFVHTYLMVNKLGPRVEVPTLSVWKWDRMWEMSEDPDSLLVVLDWVARQNVPKELVSAVVQMSSLYIEEGGRLEDLLYGTAGPDTPYKRIKRMAGIERKWLRSGLRLSRKSRREALELIDRMLAMLAA